MVVVHTSFISKCLMLFYCDFMFVLCLYTKCVTSFCLMCVSQNSQLYSTHKLLNTFSQKTICLFGYNKKLKGNKNG